MKRTNTNIQLFQTLLLALTALTLSACFDNNKPIEQDTHELDSLREIIAEKEESENLMMQTLRDINAGFDEISAAEGELSEIDFNAEGIDQTDVFQKMQNIESKLAANREKIAELQRQVDTGNKVSAELKRTVAQLQTQLKQKETEVAQLRQQIAEKESQINELGQNVSSLQEENAKVKEENATNAQIAHNQDAQLNTAWYVYGTAKELKEHRILVDGRVMEDANVDKGYFTKIDIRRTTEIPFYSKKVELLSNHPANSYTLSKDSNGNVTLFITEPSRFWSTSKYLVAKVK